MIWWRFSSANIGRLGNKFIANTFGNRDTSQYKNIFPCIVIPITTALLTLTKRHIYTETPPRYQYVNKGIMTPYGVAEPGQYWIKSRFVVAGWHTYVSESWVSIGPDNGLSSVRRQAIIWTNADSLLIGPEGTNFKIFFFNFLNSHSRKYTWICHLRSCCLGLNMPIWRQAIIQTNAGLLSIGT